MPYFSVLVGNLRADPDYAPDADETLVRGDREHPVLGNHGFAMKDKSLYERRRVIEAFARRLDLDTAQSGPLSRLIRDLARRAREGEKLRLMCWCSPLPCHLHVVAARVRLLAESPELLDSDLPSSAAVIPELFLGFGPSTRNPAPTQGAPARTAPAAANPGRAPMAPAAQPSPAQAALGPRADSLAKAAASPFASSSAPGASRSGWGKPKT